jgi:membrane protease YdiL (CAAX protease family)
LLLIIAIPSFGLSQLNRRIFIMSSPFQDHHLLAYAFQVFFESAVLAYVWVGLLLAKTRLRDLIGGKWARVKDFVRDIGIALILWIAAVVMLIAMHFILRNPAGGVRAVLPLLPQGYAEMIGWVFMSIAAGFCEEIIFRGYLQRQFLALSGRADLAVVFQAVLFGSAHLYQGIGGAITIAVYGILFGIAAVWAKSLRPGIIQHAAQDSFAGIIGGLLLKYHHL